MMRRIHPSILSARGFSSVALIALLTAASAGAGELGKVATVGPHLNDDASVAYRAGGTKECVGTAEVAFVDRSGNPVSVAGASAVAYLPSGTAQSAKVVNEMTDSLRLPVRSGIEQTLDVTFALGMDQQGVPATFVSRLHGAFQCDRTQRFEIALDAAADVRGDADLAAAVVESKLFDVAAADLLSTSIDSQEETVVSQGANHRGSLLKAGNNTSTCATDTFDSQGGQWLLANIGDADQGAVSVAGTANLTSDGTSLYHGTDNGAFFYQERSGGFRMEVDLVGFPVNAGGGFRKAGVMVRADNSASAPRVFIQYVPNNPLTGTSSLQFDYRGNDGVAAELGSTPMGLGLPLRMAVDRRGNTFTVYFSTNGGNSWIRPAGGAGGSVSINMPDTVNVGMMAASYHATTTMTASFDNFRLCEPNKIPLPTPPPGVVCAPGRPIDLIHVIDASGSMTNPFGPGETKLDAVRNAMVAMHDLLEANLPGSRAALIAYSGKFNNPSYNLTSSVHLLSTLTTDLNSVDAAASAIDQGLIHPDSTTPLPFALQATTDLLLSLGNLNSLPVVVVWTDGFPNVDLNGYDALFYTNDEMRNLSLYDGSGGFIPWSQVAWMGNYNPAIGTYDGEVWARTMQKIEGLKNSVADALIYGIAIQSDSIFKEDLLDYAAWYTSAEVLSVQNSLSLVEGLGQIVDGLDCGGDVGDYVWDDANGDGVQDAGETGLAGVTLSLVDASGNVVATTTTDADGYYYFADIEAGNYTVVVDASTLPAGYVATWDSDGGTLGTTSVTVVDDVVILTVDFGYQFQETGDPWCPRTPGYWKNHLDMWPVSSLTIGGVVYDEAGILALLNYGGPDAATRLAKHLATTMLNLEMGSDSSTIQSTVDAAQAFLADNPPGSNPRRGDRSTANDLKDVLDAYNNDPACH